MPNVMAALPNIGGALFNAAVWLTPTSRVPCTNAAKTRNPLKFAGVPQTNETISAASGPKLTSFFPIVDTCLSCEDRPYSPTKLYDGAQMAIFCIIFASCISIASRVRHISDLHSKFALRSRHV